MADVNKDQDPSGGNPNDKNPDGGNDNHGDIALPTTIEELTALMQREGDKRVASALKTREDKLNADFAAKLEEAKTEAARLAKLSTAEREKAEFEKERKAFETQRAEFTKTQMLNQTMIELQKEGLPISFAEHLMSDDAETTINKIKDFKTLWQSAMQAEVDEKLKGKSPKTGSEGSTGVTADQFKKMGYKERAALQAANPQLYTELSKI